MSYRMEGIIGAVHAFLEQNLDAHLKEYSVKFRLEFSVRCLGWILYADAYKIDENQKIRLIHSESKKLEKAESEFRSTIQTTREWLDYHATFPLGVLPAAIEIMEKIKIALHSKQMKPLGYIKDAKFKQKLLENN
jgi:hypothetical protein